MAEDTDEVRRKRLSKAIHVLRKKQIAGNKDPEISKTIKTLQKNLDKIPTGEDDSGW